MRKNEVSKTKDINFKMDVTNVKKIDKGNISDLPYDKILTKHSLNVRKY